MSEATKKVARTADAYIMLVSSAKSSQIQSNATSDRQRRTEHREQFARLKFCKYIKHYL